MKSFPDACLSTYGYYANIGAGVTRYGIYTTGEHKNYFSAKVGIGTASPTALLHLYDGHIRSQQVTKPTIAVTTANGITAAATATRPPAHRHRARDAHQLRGAPPLSRLLKRRDRTGHDR